MTKDQIQSSAIMMIANAGSAFDHFYRSISYARENHYEEAEVEMRLGSEELIKAHNSQTDLLAAEMGQEDIPFSILMVHAQDHLNMALFTQRIAKEFIMLYKEVRKSE